MTSDVNKQLVIGVLALQGAIEEHVVALRKVGVEAKEIRLPRDFEGVDGIILPGGESTTMAIVGEEYGIFPVLKRWVQDNKPIWGTCAGMILLSDHAIKQKDGGQSLVGGLDVHVCRNFFGPQINSCKIDIEVPLPMDNESSSYSSSYSCGTSFPAVFIRAPAIIKYGERVRKLASLKAKPHISARKEVYSLLYADFSEASVEPSSVRSLSEDQEIEVTVAVQQGNILAIAFHPELTNDIRWHRYFCEIVRNYKCLV